MDDKELADLVRKHGQWVHGFMAKDEESGVESPSWFASDTAKLDQILAKGMLLEYHICIELPWEKAKELGFWPKKGGEG